MWTVWTTLSAASTDALTCVRVEVVLSRQFNRPIPDLNKFHKQLQLENLNQLQLGSQNQLRSENLNLLRSENLSLLRSGNKNQPQPENLSQHPQENLNLLQGNPNQLL